MKLSDQGNILAIKLFDPGRERFNWRYGSDYPLFVQVPCYMCGEAQSVFCYCKRQCVSGCEHILILYGMF